MIIPGWLSARNVDAREREVELKDEADEQDGDVQRPESTFSVFLSDDLHFSSDLLVLVVGLRNHLLVHPMKVNQHNNGEDEEANDQDHRHRDEGIKECLVRVAPGVVGQLAANHDPDGEINEQGE